MVRLSPQRLLLIEIRENIKVCGFGDTFISLSEIPDSLLDI